MPNRRLATLLLLIFPLVLGAPVVWAEAPVSKRILPRPSRHGPSDQGRRAAVRLPIPPIPPGTQSGSAAAPTAQAAKPPEQDPNKGPVTGLALPRFVSLRADVVNLRAGPGTRYPIDWVYKRAGMPVEILREFDVWRLVDTPDGEKGWMHEATLVGRRDVIITGHEQTLRAEASDNARPVAELQPGVIAHVLSCAAGAAWCRVQVGDYRGWLPRLAFWGTLPNEAINP
jgi:SH3-like domain-containing protein